MSYMPPIGSELYLELAALYQSPGGASVNLEFDASAAIGIRQAAVANSGATVGGPSVIVTPVAKAKGYESLRFGKVSMGTDTPKIMPLGIDCSITVGTPEYVRWPQFADPRSIPAPIWPLGTLRTRLMGGYNPPPADSLILNWYGEPYSTPPASALQIDFGALGYGYILPSVGDMSVFGLPSMTVPDGIRVTGIEPLPIPQPDIQTATNNIRTEGFEFTQWGRPLLERAGRAVLPKGIEAPAFYKHSIWNLLQIIPVKGFDSKDFGEAFFGGGVKLVSVKGVDQSKLGKAELINTTANQDITPKGESFSVFGLASLSPRMLYPGSIYGTASDGALVQFPPRPTGWESARLGEATIDYWVTYTHLDGIETGEIVGYPKVFDPTQAAFPRPVLGTGIFGDVTAFNLSAFLYPNGIDSFEGSGWAELRSNKRAIEVAGIEHPAASESSIRNKTPSLIPAGIDALKSSTQFIDFRVRYIYGRGTDHLMSGKATVTKTPSIAPKGISGVIGDQNVWYRVRTLFVSGKAADLHGMPSIWFRYRYLNHEGESQSRYGKPLVEHGRRFLLGLGAPKDRYGKAAVSNANRYIDPKSIYEELATGHMVGGTRYLLPIGFDAALFGARIIPPITAVYPLGFSGVYGQALVFNSLQEILPSSINWPQPADRWGKGRVWNLRQYITLYFDPDSQLNPPRWPQWTAIENRTKALRTTGQDASRIGDQQVFNAARPVLLEGIDALTTSESGMIAMRYRPLRIEGMDAPYISSWSVVANDAMVIKPGGFDGHGTDRHLIEYTRRYYNWVGGCESARLGYPMVADRIRNLFVEKRYSIDAPRIELPSVKLYTRYVDGIGYDPAGIGLASLSIHWTLITPRWTLRNDYGYPRAHNVTPELGTQGRASDEFGDTHVRLEWRPISLDGAITTLFGRSGIAYRDRMIPVTGIRAWAFGDKLAVIKTGAPPYSLQYIYLNGKEKEDGTFEDGYGIEPPEDESRKQVPDPIINQQVVYVRQQDPATKFGNAIVESNSIRVEPGYYELSIGDHYVGLKVRRVTVQEFPDEEVFDPSLARVSPYTIYAVMEAPAQAKQNHPVGSPGLHYIDGYRRQPGTIFGRPVVTLRHRRLYARSYYWHLLYGSPRVELGTNYILPTGFSSMRNGFHEIPGTRELVQFDSNQMSAFGKPKTWRYIPPGPRDVKPRALLATQFSKSLIEHFHRQVFPKGYTTTLMGTRKPGDRPYMWQGLRVGPLMPTIPDGVDQSVMAEPRVSRRVREVTIEGFIAFISEYQLEAFDQRMRVANTYRPMPKEQEVDAAGFSTDQTGTPDIKRAVHYIRPDGNAHQYRKGAL